MQIPWEFEGLNNVAMKVSLGDFSSAVYDVQLATTSPAAFERNDASGRLMAAVVDPTLGVVETGNPTPKGSTVQIYCNGMGPVDTPQSSGEPSSTQSLSRTRDLPTVTIGGRPATVQFSGLAPGFVGLYQVNVDVPQDAPSGAQPVVITIRGVESKPAILPIQ